MNLVTEYPWWFVVFCLLLGAAYATLLYFKSPFFKESSAWLRRLLWALRFTLITFLAYLLLGPLLKSLVTESEKPVIIFAQDNSESLIIGKDSSFYKNEYITALKTFKDDLNDKYDVRFYSFGDQVKNTSSFTYSDKQTNISEMVEEIYNRFANRNVGAVILASDGIYNKGSNPVYASEKINAPFYTVALGDPKPKKDIILTKVFHNRLAYLGNTFPLEILVNINECANCKTNLTVSHKGKVLFTKQVQARDNSSVTTVPVQIEAKEAGMQRYRIKLSEVEGEVTYENNEQDIFIDVLDSRQKILILANSPHPDIAALKSAIENNQNYEVVISLVGELTRPLKEFSLVILHQLPSTNNNASKQLEEIIKFNIPRLFIVGSQSAIGQLNSLQKLVSISASPGRMNESAPALNEKFSLFTLSESTRNTISKMPPLTTIFGSYKIANSAYILFNQKIGMVKTNDPLVVFNNQEENKTGIIAGEGLWKWRIANYSENKNHEAFNEIIGKVVQYLSVKVDKSFFRIITKNNYLENESVAFDAEIYNASYELINDPEVNISIVNANGKRFPFTFTKTSNAYRLNAGAFPPGEYSYEAKAKSGENVMIEKGVFTVSEIKVETVNTLADHELLLQLAKKHDGEMYYPVDIKKLTEVIKKREDIKTVAYSEQRLEELINLKWVFFLFLLLLTVEWFLRKRNGAY